MRHMGVVSSMTVGIVIEGCLWGMYAFHSYAQKTKPTVDERILLEMAASITAMKIDCLQREKVAARRLQVHKALLPLQTVKSIQDFLSFGWKPILAVVDADALVIYEAEKEGRQTFGDATILPTEEGEKILRTSCRLNSHLLLNQFSSGLSGDGAGVLYFKHLHVSVAFVRKAIVSDVKWAGNPNRIQDETVPGRLCPRASFELYMEKGRKESRTWTAADCSVAEFVVDRIDQFFHRAMLQSFRMSLEQNNSRCLQAVEAARERYEFFAHLSHELRTPFHSVLSALHLLKNPAIADGCERKELVKSALECGKTMIRTLDDILSIAQNKKCIDMKIVPLVISKISETTFRMMLPVADLKSINLKNEVGQVQVESENIDQETYRSLMVVGDETRLGQMATNLTNNAIKFTPPGGQVIIRTHLVPSQDAVWAIWHAVCELFIANFVSNVSFPENTCNDTTAKASEVWYIFQVEDSGCGINGDDMHTMFDAYKQLSSENSKTFEGTGLGLHICRLHTEQLGGLFGVASTFGEGSLFMVAIPMGLFFEQPPLLSADLSLSNIGVGFISSESSDTNPVSPSLFLIVDDSLINLKLSKRKMLMALGDSCTVVTAEDGLECISIYQEYIESGIQPTLTGIFMDYHMPKCSGLEAIRKIRRIEHSNPELNPVHIVAFTADMSETSSRELINAGATEVLAKPPAAGQFESICVRLATKKQDIETREDISAQLSTRM